MTIEADRLYADQKQGSGVYIAEGNAVVHRQNMVIQADRITFDDVHKRAIAEGHVTVIEPTSVLLCTKVEMHLPDMRGFLIDVELRIKSPIPESVRAAMSAQKLIHYGKDQLIVDAERMDRLGKREIDIDGGVFTSCDCGEGATPTWQINASYAHVDLDSGAFLWLPVFHIEGVPVLPLPAFYFPLGARRTGLLVPRIAGIGNTITGLRLGEPLFLALSESWDMTIEPEFYQYRGLAGDFELRWAPEAKTHGQVNLTLLQDRGVLGAGGYHLKAKVKDAIYRFAIGAKHDQRLGGARLVADVNLVGDPIFLNEFVDQFLARQAESTTSRLTLTSTGAQGGGTRLAAGLLFIEDLRIARYGADPTHPFSTTVPRDLRTIELLSSEVVGGGEIRQRFFDARLDAAPYPLFGEKSPLLGEARLSLAALAAPRPDVPRFARADFRPAISLPLHIGVLTFETALAGRLTAWAGRANEADVAATRFALVADALLFTELGRRYDLFFHRIRPELRYVIIPYVDRRGDDVFKTNDEIDLLAAVQQVSARVRNDFMDGPGGRRLGGFDAWFGRDLGLPGHSGIGNSELVLRGDVEIAPAGFPLRATLFSNAGIAPKGWLSPETTDTEPSNPHPALLTELLAGMTVASNRGDALTLIYGNFNAHMPTSTLIATEEITPSRTVDTTGYVPRSIYVTQLNASQGGDPAAVRAVLSELPWSSYQGLVVTALAKPVKQLTMQFGITIAPDPSLTPIRNTSSLIRWDSDCDCFGVGIVAVTDRYRPPGLFGLPQGFSANFVISLGRLGEVRSSR
jgi:hypothetical protein